MSKPEKSNRVELAYVEVCSETRPRQGENRRVKIIERDAKTRLFVGEVAGLPCVVVENPDWKVPTRIPMTNVAGFGVHS